MKLLYIFLLSLFLTLVITPITVCYIITGKLKIKDLKKIYYILFYA